MDLFRKKHYATQHHSQLKRCLNSFDLTLLGIGAIIGAGIFILTGIAAATKAGPAVFISFILAGFACAFSALSYAELASSVGGSGSAYSYSYVGFGEIIAWMIGWDLLLEYGIAAAAVAIGWSAYVNNLLLVIGIHLPKAFITNPFDGGIMDLPAMLIILFIALLLIIGVRQSAWANNIMVGIKLLAIAIFIGFASFHVDTANWHPLFPFGWHGVVSGAGLIFFAYIGFDAVSTAAEEAIEPQRTMPIGIIASLTICTLIYVLVSALLTGATSYKYLNVAAPVAEALIRMGHHGAAGLISVGAIAGLTTVILVMYYGLTRILYAISRDGLLPRIFSHVNSRTHTPIFSISLCSVIMMLIAGFMPMTTVAELVNIGTLAGFALVCGGVLIMRITHPEMPRPFKVPFSPVTPLLGVLICLYLMFSLDAITWLRFFVWLAIGMIIYFVYGRKKSVLAKAQK